MAGYALEQTARAGTPADPLRHGGVLVAHAGLAGADGAHALPRAPGSRRPRGRGRGGRGAGGRHRPARLPLHAQPAPPDAPRHGSAARPGRRRPRRGGAPPTRPPARRSSRPCCRTAGRSASAPSPTRSTPRSSAGGCATSWRRPRASWTARSASWPTRASSSGPRAHLVDGEREKAARYAAERDALAARIAALG